MPGLLNKTLDYADLSDRSVRPTVTSIKRWVWRWLIRGGELGVNGHVKRRFYIRRHKMWEYARGLALTDVTTEKQIGNASLNILDVGGAMTAPVLYLAELGHHVVCLDIDETMTAQTNAHAKRFRLSIDARTTNLGEESVTPGDFSVEHGFDRVYCFCVIEHVPRPMQFQLIKRTAGLLRPGGQMCVTFDFGEHAPTEAPLYSREHVEEIRSAINLPLKGNQEFQDNGLRFPLEHHHPGKPYTFGSLFFTKPN